jgi:hypothetical protein
MLMVFVAAFVGIVFFDAIGARYGWTPLQVFLATAAFLGGLAWIRRGLTRPIMFAFIFLQAIPVFGTGAAASWTPPLALLLLALTWRRWIGRLSRTELMPRPDHDVVPGARGAVDELLQMGFQMVGAADATGPGYHTIFNYLVSADRRTYAVATDRVQTLASQFGDLILVSINRASAPVPPTELRQLAHEDFPDLYGTHKAALDVLAEMGRQPDSLAPARVMERSLREERRTIDFLTARPWWVAAQMIRGVVRRQPPDSKLIGRDPQSKARIERWLASS